MRLRSGASNRVEELQQHLEAARNRIAALEQELAARNLRDPLTGVHSQDAFARRLTAEVDRSRRHGRELSVAALDVDGFHAVNATYGREVGDEVLRAVAATLAKGTRTSDIVCRSSADQFVVMLPETDAAAATEALGRLLLDIEALEVGPVAAVSLSVGIADWRRPMTADALMGEAERQMRIARDAGGGRAETLPPVADGPGKPGRDPNGDAIAGLAEALLERDRYTGEHSESVVELTARVARGLALDDVEVERVRAAALLHDIGKVAIPDHVLNKDGPLDDDEWVIMREHPVIGERILRAIPGLGHVARIVRHEHERWDGGGYPDGLVGEAIPIGARIILACDAYHAMTSDRPYRKAMSHAEAVRELAGGAGTQFDPQVTEVLIGALYGTRRTAEGAAASGAAA